ncbi:MAG: 4Fe-4S binding protein [Candidatus Marinimicrobia bacterium]|nr:4Fe-4S binding protein [Candidatus Neomarinimicrobiota bacterium]
MALQISGQITDLITFGTYGIEVLMILGLDTLVFKRQWCKFVCPVGAALAFFHRGKSFRITAEATRCKHCDQRKNHPCNVECPLQLNPRKDDIYPYCYNCFDCVQVCARNGKALSIAYDKK